MKIKPGFNTQEEIVKLLKDGPKRPKELAEELGMSASNVRRSLRLLCKRGEVVRFKRVGSPGYVYYCLDHFPKDESLE